MSSVKLRIPLGFSRARKKLVQFNKTFTLVIYKSDQCIY